jgi:tRNA(Ile)-lysidine synthase
VLLHSLQRIAVTYPLQLRAVHVDHGLHADSGLWAEHCRQTCAELQVPIDVLPVSVPLQRGDSLEEQARHARYQALAGYLHDGEACVTAQHLDDQAETVLLQLLRGSGVHGLAAMPACAALGHGTLLRPFLTFSREQLRDYADRHELQWLDDPSNRDLRHDRNYVRTRVLPGLRQRWPAAERVLARSARHAAAAAHILDETGRRDLKYCRAHTCADETADIAYLDVNYLACLERERQQNALRTWLRGHGLPVPGDKRLQSILQLFARGSRRRGCVAWQQVEVRLAGDTLWLRHRPRDLATKAAVYRWDPAHILRLQELGITLHGVPVAGQGIDQRLLHGKTLTVRFRRGGESCRMPGDHGHKPLRKMFQDLGVPDWQRARMPLIFLGDELVAISSLWMSAHVLPARGKEGILIAQWTCCD